LRITELVLGISEENILEVNGKTLGVLIRHPFSVIRFPQVFKVAQLL